MRKTKIISTLGPATATDEIIKELMLSGMNVARFNFSRGTHEQHKEKYDQVARIRDELNLPVATLLDTKGPEIRIGLMEGDKKVMLEKGKRITLTTKDMLGTAEMVSITYKNLPKDIGVGGRILIDDGLIELKVVSLTDEDIVCDILNDGLISNRKGVNVPDAHLSMDYISEQDRKDIIFGAKTGFDFIAGSFVRSAYDVMAIKNVLEEVPGNNMKIISKIENLEGVENIDSILRISDGVMIARGDMGVEIPFEQLPAIQKMIMKKAVRAGKIVITATQMLESMIKNPRPTRAETSDVANAIYDGTSAIMLSGETAAGAYPIESVRTMALIARHAEHDIKYAKRFRNFEFDSTTVTDAISRATVTTSLDLKAKAIITVTKAGKTALMISRFKPVAPIVCCSPDPKAVRQLNLAWGVYPMLVDEAKDSDTLFASAVQKATEQGYVDTGDLVVITAGVPLGVSGTTNLMRVHIVGDIIITGKGVENTAIENVTCGNICIGDSVATIKASFREGDILVANKTDDSYIQFIKAASGIICEDGEDSHARTTALALGIPVIVGAANATERLRNGTTVRLDAVNGYVQNISAGTTENKIEKSKKK